MLFQRLALVCLVLLIASVSDAGWPSFRGPVPKDLKADSLPLKWGPEKNIRWNVELPGTGQSSPVIWDQHAYLTTVEGPNKETCHVLAVDIVSGEKLWQGSIPNASPVKSTNYVSKAAPTAVTDEHGVIALFEGGNILALRHDGTRRWERNLVKEFGPIVSRHGLGSSLLQSEKAVYAWIERAEDPYLLAINKETGKDLWKVPGLGVTSWSSPIVITVDGMKQLVFSGSGLIRGLSPADGKVLWEFKDISSNATPSPTAVGDGLILVGATVGRGEEGGKGKASDSNGLLRVTKSDTGEFSADFVWQAKRATSSFGSPIAHQGLAYFVNRSGVLYCLDLKTGEEVYVQRTPESCWATPLAVGDRIYLVGKSGTTTVIRAGRKFEVLAENRLWNTDPDEEPPAFGAGPVQYAVAAIPGNLLIRTGEHLFDIGK